MVSSRVLLALVCLSELSAAQCPFSDAANLKPRQYDDTVLRSSREMLEQYEVDDSSGYMTSDVGGPFGDQVSLKAGERGSTLLEDFIFRQKITHFDHERVSSPS
jgi:catalase